MVELRSRLSDALPEAARGTRSVIYLAIAKRVEQATLRSRKSSVAGFDTSPAPAAFSRLRLRSLLPIVRGITIRDGLWWVL